MQLGDTLAEMYAAMLTVYRHHRGEEAYQRVKAQLESADKDEQDQGLELLNTMFENDDFTKIVNMQILSKYLKEA